MVISQLLHGVLGQLKNLIISKGYECNDLDTSGIVRLLVLTVEHHLQKLILVVSILLSEKGGSIISWLPDGVIEQFKDQMNSKRYKDIDFEILGIFRVLVFVAKYYLQKLIVIVSILPSEKGALVIPRLPGGVIGRIKAQLYSKGYKDIDFEISDIVRILVYAAEYYLQKLILVISILQSEKEELVIPRLPEVIGRLKSQIHSKGYE